jgi:hypothetical protein
LNPGGEPAALSVITAAELLAADPGVRRRKRFVETSHKLFTAYVKFEPLSGGGVCV